MTFWAVFIGLVLVPVLSLAIELGRYFYAIAEVQKAADAAAVAASADFDVRVFEETGVLIPTASTWGTARTYAALNGAGLAAKGVRVFVSGIQVSNRGNTLQVEVSANLSRLFPSLVPEVLVSRIGVASLRAMTH
ncbi:MAG: pilus assembly protein TadG-related protein [Chloroflexi bacterium]|nr:pilus assembly protein TadG-related protein [Chloroflexota bacterium]